MISRVTNREVLQKTRQRPLSTKLLQQQLALYGKAARAPDGDPLRDAVFCPGSMRPAADRYVRKQGRPRHEWADKLLNVGLQVAGSFQRLEELVRNKAQWEAEVREFCSRVVSLKF